MHFVNRTPFEGCALPSVAHDDTHWLVVVVKGTFALGPSGTAPAIADEPVPIHLEDVYWGEPGLSSLKYEADTAIEKPGTDIALIGTAYAPSGPVRQLDVGIKIGSTAKIVRVFGDREWRKARGGFALTEPTPFETMPLVYERAYGGVDPVDPSRGGCDENPLGKGFASPESLDEIDSLPAPNLELRDRPIKSITERPEPAGFGFVARHWQPRRALAGTYDDAWLAERCPLLPADFDPRSQSAASPGLVNDGYLAGGESVVIVNASPEGRIEFPLPRRVIEATAVIAGEQVDKPLRLDTVVIEPDERRIALTWRAAIPCHWNLAMVEWIRVSERG